MLESVSQLNSDTEAINYQLKLCMWSMQVLGELITLQILLQINEEKESIEWREKEQRYQTSNTAFANFDFFIQNSVYCKSKNQ